MLNEKYYALKEIPLYKLSSFNRIYAYLNEPKILKKLNNYQFLQKIICSFHDYDNLYLVINYYPGGNLYNYRNIKMSEEQIKFISACIIQSLTYLRKEKIISRDVKMQNIIMDRKKYLNLIDFSFAINYSDRTNKKKYIFVSPLESSPESKKYKIYDYSSDYYGLGEIIYYLIFKTYINCVKKKNNVSEILLDFNNITNYSKSCIDFVNKLIIEDYRKRNGFNSINELKNHSWFNNFDWKNFENKKIESPLWFMRKKQSKCSKLLTKRKKRKKKFKYYIRLIKKYDYINKNIINKILNSNKNMF